MMKQFRAAGSVLVPVLLIFALISASCGSSAEDVGGNSGSVTLYSGRTEDLVAPVLDLFSEETGIEVEVKYAGSAELAALIAQEGDKSPADVFLSQSPGPVGFLEAGGLLAELPSSITGLVADELSDDDGRWVAVSGRQRVLVYHPDRVATDELPASIDDLADPAWSGRLGIAPTNGSFQDFLTAMRAERGDEATLGWLSALADNEVQTYPKNGPIVEAVARGEIDAGLVNHYYNFRSKAEDPDHPAENHQFADGDIGGVLIVTAAARLASSDNADNAEALIEFLLSKEAQEFFASDDFEYPLAAGVEPAGSVPAANFSDVGGIGFDQLDGGLEGTRDLIADAGFDS